MTIPNIKSGIPLRVWDILGSQSFLLTNYQSELCEHFTPGKHFAIFESKEDLTAKVDFYLRHDTLRQKIALTGWEAIQKDHTYEQQNTTDHADYSAIKQLCNTPIKSKSNSCDCDSF